MNIPSSSEGGIKELLEKLVTGDRRALAKSITLVESHRREDLEAASRLTNAALKHAGNSVRIGLSGAPGVGKSTFIEALGTWLTDSGLKVAVLAVDPSSQRSGGSILGDKTRMPRLSQTATAFIRPTPSGTTLGGVARRTRESIVLVEAAGFDVVIVETVGVGQSETAVSDMVDIFTLLISPSGGDELQGIKRGIMELADIALVTKADGDLLQAASRTAAEYAAGLHFMRPRIRGWTPEVGQVSSPTRQGIAEYWEIVKRLCDHLRSTGQWEEQRRSQRLSWFWTELREGLVAQLRENEAIAAEIAELESQVAAGQKTPASAAGQILAKTFLKP